MMRITGSCLAVGFFEDFEEIENLVKAGLLTREDQVIRLTPKGQDLANQVFVAFV